MTKLNEHLIDLGAASVETKGSVTTFQPDEINQHRLQPGLSND